MGATLIVADPELALVLSGTHLPTSKGWKAEFVHYATAAEQNILPKQNILLRQLIFLS